MKLLEQLPLPFAAPSPPVVLEHADFVRMGKQRALILAYMSNGAWWTLAELSEVTGFPEASISARVRDFRKAQYGAHEVDRERVAAGHGLFRYRLRMRP